MYQTKMHAPPADNSTGVALMLMPSAEQQKFVSNLGETTTPVDDLHVTIAYFGDTEETALNQHELENLGNEIAGMFAPIEARLAGITRFVGGDEGDPLVINIDAASLEEVRMHLIASVGDKIKRNHGYTPHMTIGYLKADEEIPYHSVRQQYQASAGDIPTITLNRLDIAWGGKHVIVELTGNRSAETKEPETKARSLRRAVGRLRRGGGGGGGDRRVRTPEGAARFGQPIGAIITPDMIAAAKERDKRRAERGGGGTPKRSRDGQPGTTKPGPSDADKISNAERMYGTGSRQHRAAQKRFGGGETPKRSVRRSTGQREGSDGASQRDAEAQRADRAGRQALERQRAAAERRGVRRPSSTPDFGQARDEEIRRGGNREQSERERRIQEQDRDRRLIDQNTDPYKDPTFNEDAPKPRAPRGRRDGKIGENARDRKPVRGPKDEPPVTVMNTSVRKGKDGKFDWTVTDQDGKQVGKGRADSRERAQEQADAASDAERGKRTDAEIASRDSGPAPRREQVRRETNDTNRGAGRIRNVGNATQADLEREHENPTLTPLERRRIETEIDERAREGDEQAARWAKNNREQIERNQNRPFTDEESDDELRERLNEIRDRDDAASQQERRRIETELQERRIERDGIESVYADWRDEDLRKRMENATSARRDRNRAAVELAEREVDRETEGVVSLSQEMPKRRSRFANARKITPEERERMAAERAEIARQMDAERQERLARAEGAEQPEQEDDGVLTSVNPTGGVFVTYDPEQRARAPLADNLTSLAETMGLDPDEMVTVYRGAPDSQGRIVPGDFITTNPQLARDYAAGRRVLTAQVPARDILDDRNEPGGEEYLYRPNASGEKPSTAAISDRRVVLPEGVDTISNAMGERQTADGLPYPKRGNFVIQSYTTEELRRALVTAKPGTARTMALQDLAWRAREGDGDAAIVLQDIDDYGDSTIIPSDEPDVESPRELTDVRNIIGRAAGPGRSDNMGIRSSPSAFLIRQAKGEVRTNDEVRYDIIKELTFRAKAGETTAQAYLDEIKTSDGVGASPRKRTLFERGSTFTDDPSAGYLRLSYAIDARTIQDRINDLIDSTGDFEINGLKFMVRDLGLAAGQPSDVFVSVKPNSSGHPILARYPLNTDDDLENLTRYVNGYQESQVNSPGMFEIDDDGLDNAHFVQTYGPSDGQYGVFYLGPVKITRQQDTLPGSSRWTAEYNGATIFTGRSSGGSDEAPYRRSMLRSLSEQTKRSNLVRRPEDRNGMPSIWDFDDGTLGRDWLPDDETVWTRADWDNKAKRKMMASDHSTELGITFGSETKSGDNIELHERVNAIARAYEEMFPGFKDLLGDYTVARSGREMASNAKSGRPGASRYNWMNFNSKYFAASKAATGKIVGAYLFSDHKPGSSKHFALSNFEQVAIDTGRTQQEIAYSYTINHELGHTVARSIFGESVTAQTPGAPDRRQQARLWNETMAPILRKFEIIDDASMQAMLGGDSQTDTSNYSAATRRLSGPSAGRGNVRWNVENLKKQLSGYGTTNLHEMMAETWAGYMTDTRPTEFVLEMGQAMEQMFIEWQQAVNNETTRLSDDRRDPASMRNTYRRRTDGSIARYGSTDAGEESETEAFRRRMAELRKRLGQREEPISDEVVSNALNLDQAYLYRMQGPEGLEIEDGTHLPVPRGYQPVDTTPLNLRTVIDGLDDYFQRRRNSTLDGLSDNDWNTEQETISLGDGYSIEVFSNISLDNNGDVVTRRDARIMFNGETVGDTQSTRPINTEWEVRALVSYVNGARESAAYDSATRPQTFSVPANMFQRIHWTKDSMSAQQGYYGPIRVRRKYNESAKTYYWEVEGPRNFRHRFSTKSKTNSPEFAEAAEIVSRKYRNPAPVRDGRQGNDSVWTVWEGVKGKDFLYDDDEGVWEDDDWENPTKRALMAQDDSQDLGYEFGSTDPTGDGYDIETHELTNATMRAYNEMYPGFARYVPVIAISDLSARGANGINSQVYDERGRASQVTLDKGMIARARSGQGFKGQLGHSAYDDDGNLIKTSGWYAISNFPDAAREAGVSLENFSLLHTLNHELGHTVARMIWGEFAVAPDDDTPDYNDDFSAQGRYAAAQQSQRWYERMAPIFRKYGVIDVETERRLTTPNLLRNRPFQYPVQENEFGFDRLAGTQFPGIKIDVKRLQENLGEYASSNFHEVMAETWAAYMMDHNPTEFVLEMGREMEQMMLQYMEDNDLDYASPESQRRGNGPRSQTFAPLPMSGQAS